MRILVVPTQLENKQEGSGVTDPGILEGKREGLAGRRVDQPALNTASGREQMISVKHTQVPAPHTQHSLLGLNLVTTYFHETLCSAPLVLPVGLQNSLLSTSPMVP